MRSSFFVTLNRFLAVQSLFLSSASLRHVGLKPSSLLLRTFATKKPYKTDLVMRSKSYGDFYEGKSLSPAYYPKSENQKVYYAAVNNPEIPIVLGVGAAGTGKTLFALTAAINALKTGKIQKIVLTRPIVPVDEEELGFLPGDLKNKMAPWTQPMFDIFLEYYSKMALDLMVKEGVIEISPLAFMRGRTFKKCFVIADEMQNSSPNQMMMLTTRIGTDTRLFITGDLAQTDREGTNGLTDFVVRARKPDSLVDQGLVKIVNFGAEDVERSMIVNRVVEMYNSKQKLNVTVMTEKTVVSTGAVKPCGFFNKSSSFPYSYSNDFPVMANQEIVTNISCSLGNEWSPSVAVNGTKVKPGSLGDVARKGEVDETYSKTKKPASNDCALIPKEHISENIRRLGHWDIGKLNL
jgi:phosphate starvation-inducible PhoH-like protein